MKQNDSAWLGALNFQRVFFSPNVCCAIVPFLGTGVLNLVLFQSMTMKGCISCCPDLFFSLNKHPRQLPSAQ